MIYVFASEPLNELYAKIQVNFYTEVTNYGSVYKLYGLSYGKIIYVVVISLKPHE